MSMHFSEKYYAVQTRDRQLIHVMLDTWGQTGSTPSGLLAPRKKTLCGLYAARNVDEIFGPEEATCPECLRRYERREGK
jgi:hypothetical protein